ncbi:metal-dependent hydrolase [bacterium]|nr:metal-dependent hydrolase [bacterium]
MSTQVTFYGHGTFAIETSGKTVLIDPFFTDNPSATVSAADVSADAIIISHGHFDHLADVVSIAKRTGATVISNFEIITWLQKQGIENGHPMNTGGQAKFDWGTVKLTLAFHSSSLPDGSNGGSPSGVLLKTADGAIYHACDTALFGDMKLIGEEGIDLAILPIGDNFTMGPDDALRAVKLIEPKRVVPDHYNTWPPIAQDASVWADRVRAETSTEPVVLQPGESLTL